MQGGAVGGKWISIEKELPPLNLSFDAWHVSEGRVANMGAYVGHWDDDFRREVMLVKGFTHWMHKPGIPHGE